MDLSAFAAEVGRDDPVTIAGAWSRGGAVPFVRRVSAPSGIIDIQPDEMVVSCGAGTPVDELAVALAEVGQRVALPPGGTVGGALAVGQASVRRLGDGPVRDTLLQATYVSAAGELVRAGGPTVKNVSGFDICRLLVGSRGTLGFLGSVLLRTKPLPARSQWCTTLSAAPYELFAALHRPVSVLWDGARVWVLLEGNGDDIDDAMRRNGLEPIDGPPALPDGRTLVAPHQLPGLHGRFIAELGVGVVRGECSVAPDVPARPAALVQRLKTEFDPTGRLNPGFDV